MHRLSWALSESGATSGMTPKDNITTIRFMEVSDRLLFRNYWAMCYVSVAAFLIRSEGIPAKCLLIETHGARLSSSRQTSLKFSPTLQTPRHEGVWGTENIVPCIHDFDTR
jgi:hypothetical protein